MIDRNKLVFMESYQNPLCRLYLSVYHVTRTQNTIKVHYLEMGKNAKGEKTKTQIAVAQIKGPEIFADEVMEICPERKYRSCLSFVPSSVQHISILSGQSPEQRFRGFINLAVIMFIVLNLRNILENFRYYGFRFKAEPKQFINPLLILSVLGLSVFIEVAYNLERLRFTRVFSDRMAKNFMIINQCLLVVYNIMFCREMQNNPIQNMGLTILSVVTVLKLISYMQVNSELILTLRRLNSSKQNQFNEFLFANHEINDENLNLIRKFKANWDGFITRSRLWYFIFAPTLCYQLSYPRTSSIRYVWLAKRFIQFLFITSLQLVIWMQYIDPELIEWFKVIQSQQYTTLEIFRRILRLSVPNTAMWILGFYSFFHVFLNIVGELLYFADRKFYMDWWNCRTLEEYWKTWNLPVHFWFVRHVYNPLLKKGFSKGFAMFTVFMISAVAHEFVVCVPLHLISFYAFLAMLLQAPTIIIEKKINKILKTQNSELGNATFWLFFCIFGQPTCVFMYYHLYMTQQQLLLGETLSAVIDPITQTL